jgi:pimeloyl-ACP methyl ester carboxylesterase
MNPAPASVRDLAVFRDAYARALGADLERQKEIVAGTAYQAGDPDAVVARYRLHFKHALARPADYETLMTAMDAAFHSQGSEGILKARAVEDRLMRDTWDLADYDLLPKLAQLHMPALVIAGQADFIPADVPRHIAEAIPNATLVTLENCGHFSYMECPGDVHKAFDEFFKR